MASGVGVNGGTGRCYSLWLDFTACLADAETPAQCGDNREDYIECLHHRKEISRLRQVLEEAKRQGKSPPAPEASGGGAAEPPGAASPAEGSTFPSS
jgi:NADH dehydrogenase (ubiquinone) Fe-S protein 5